MGLLYLILYYPYYKSSEIDFLGQRHKYFKLLGAYCFPNGL